MKVILKLANFIIALLFLNSCSPSNKVMVWARPGTEILDLNENILAVANDEGQAFIKLEKDSENKLLLSHQPGDSFSVPFAIDYRETPSTGLIAGLSLFGAGVGMAFATADMFNVSTFLFSLGTMLTGETIALTTFWDPNQYYKYCEVQHSNDSLTFKNAVFDVYSPEPKVSARSQETQTSVTNEKVSASNRKIVQTSTRTLKKPELLVVGDYSGSGSLKLNNKTIESYPTIYVKIIRKSDMVFLVRVVEGGSPFFSEDGEYEVKSNNSDGVVLTLSDIPAADIRINSNGELKYTHPSVGIDGGVYTLTINAKLQK